MAWVAKPLAWPSGSVSLEQPLHNTLFGRSRSADWCIDVESEQSSLSGCGKSTIARRIAIHHGLKAYVTDDMKADHGLRVTDEEAPNLCQFKPMVMDEALGTPRSGEVAILPSSNGHGPPPARARIRAERDPLSVATLPVFVVCPVLTKYHGHLVGAVACQRSPRWDGPCHGHIRRHNDG